MTAFAYHRVLPVICFGVALCGLFTYITDHETNSCTMTYMFEYPEYIKMPMKIENTKKFQRYSLYVYGEGQYAEELKQGKITGIPAIFIPGNSGSYRQVRSIASLALRMGHTLRSKFHFNVFTIDFQEELSALYGGVLEDQTAFVQECINHIQNIYPVKKQLIIIGHSMGGVIARALFSLPQFDSSSVSIIFTLSSPHKEPVLSLDSAIAAFYKKITATWSDPSKPGLRQIPMVSVGGGERDLLVRSELTSVPTIGNNYHVVVTSIPGVWMSTDHLAIVWCKQVVLTISRAMYDLVDRESEQITQNSTLTQSVLRHHFIRRSHGHHFSNLPLIPFQTFSAGQWIEQKDRSWRFSRAKILTAVYILVPLFKNEHIFVIGTGLDKPTWLFGCLATNSSNNTMCTDGINLSHHAVLVPCKNQNTQRRMINLKSSKLLKKGLSHLLVHVAATDGQVDLLGERYIRSERVKQFSLPSVFERFVTFSPVRITNFILSERSVFYNLTLSGLSNIVESVTLSLETRICSGGSVVGQGLLMLHVPWSQEDRFFHIKTTLGSITTIPVKLHLRPPSGYNNQGVQLQLILDPECSYVLFASFPVSNIASQFVKYHGVNILGYAVALLVCVISSQMHALRSKATCPSVIQTLGNLHTFLSLVVLASGLHFFTGNSKFAVPFFPSPDDITDGDSNLVSLFGLRVVLYLIAYGLLLSFIVVLEYLVTSLSFFTLWLRKKNVFHVAEKPLEISKFSFNLSYYDVGLFALLQAVAITLSGSFSLLVGFGFQFFQLLSVCSVCKADEERRGASAATSKWHFHFSCTILWLLCVLVTLPASVTWFRNLKFSLQLMNDPHKIPSMVLILSTSLMRLFKVPCYYRVYYRTASHIIHTVAFLIVLYSIKSVFRLLFFISLTFVVISLQQSISFFCIMNQAKID